MQYKPALDAATWTDLPGDVTAAGPTASATDTPGASPQRFYRITVR